MILIYKYRLNWQSDSTALVRAPPGNVLKVAYTGEGYYHAWIEHEVHPALPMRDYVFRLVMTGEELPDDFARTWEYVDTIFREWFVLHIFRRLPH